MMADIQSTITSTATSAPDEVKFLKSQGSTKSPLSRQRAGLNITDKQQVHGVLGSVEEMTDKGSRSSTKGRLTEAQMKRFVEHDDANATRKDYLQKVKQSEKTEIDKNQSAECLRMVLIGKTGGGKSATANTILGKKHFQPKVAPKLPNKTCEKATGEIDGRPVMVVNTPGLFDTTLSDAEVQQELQKCTCMSAPGPHVFLVVLQIGDLTKEETDSVEMIKKVFGKKSADFIIILFTRGDELEDQTFENYLQGCDDSIKQLLNDCGQRYHIFNNKDHTNRTQVRELVTKIETMLKINGGSYYSTEMLKLERLEDIKRTRQELVHTKLQPVPDEEEFLKSQGSMKLPPSMSSHNKPALNLVLCGRRGAGKTSAAKAILGSTEFQSVFSSACVKSQGRVHGRQVSIVKLPALYGGPQETVIKESLNCISLCDPEGVHAFILVLPVGPLTDEDKGELETIQRTFTSPVNDFTMILFTVESDPNSSAVTSFLEKRVIQELCRSCGGRRVVLNITDKQQVCKIFNAVDKMTDKGSRSFTKDMFTEAQMKRVVEHDNAYAKLKDELQKMKHSHKTEINENQSAECLRMVLIGKTGGGKSATANTILGKKHFQPRVAPKPANKTCEKATGEIDGQPVIVVNTPGLFDTTLSDAEIQQELHKAISMSAPGPHVFLVVLQIGNLTQQETESVDMITKVFGKKSADFIIVLFTRGDELEDQTCESYLQGCDDSIKQLVNYCGRRYHVFNNKDHTNRTQVRELVTKIETMLKTNGGSYYSTEMLGWERLEEITALRKELNNRKLQPGEKKKKCFIQ